MKKLMSIAVVCFAALFTVSFFSCSSQAPKASLKTSIDSVSYAQGVVMASQHQIEQFFAQFDIPEAHKDDFNQGFMETFNINDKKDKKALAKTLGRMMGLQVGVMIVPGFNSYLFGDDSTKTISKENLLSAYLTNVKDPSKLLMSVDDAQMYSAMALERIRKEEMENRFGNVKNEGQEWLENNKTKEGVVVLPSGLQYKVISEGKGAKPSYTDMVRVAYKGTTINGEVFDDSESAEFQVSGVIPGWTEGLQLMSVGSKYNFYIPNELAYGEQGMGEAIPPYAVLIFEVELLEIIK